MTTLIRGENSYFLGAQAFVLNDAEMEREISSEWASKHVNKNPAIKWILGRFVEADNPNRNSQAWTLEDLRLKQPTINHAPMNMVHQARNIVGAFVATEMLYPLTEKAGESVAHPHIEALGAFWRYYFPNEFQAVQAAHDEGSLFFSQECISENIRFEDSETGKTETFAYDGPVSKSYGDWNENRSAIKWLDNPHFLGGALILPPVRPGWANAHIKTLSQYMDENSDLAHEVFQSVSAQAPHLSGDQIEGITLGLLTNQIKEEWAELVENSNSSVHLSKKETEPSTGDLSSVSHPLGGDMDKTYTEDELKAEVAKVLAPMQAELDTLKAAADADAREAEFTALKEAHATEVAELTTKLDAATTEAAAVKSEFDTYKTSIETAAREVAEAAERAERTEARLTAVKEVASYPEEFIADNTERWVAMSDEDFEAVVAGYKASAAAAVAASKSSSEKKEVNLGTVLGGEREVSSTDDDRMSGVRGLFGLREQGIDPRTV